MRIQMRLSNEAEIILQKEKSKIKEKEDICVTYGWIVNSTTKKIYQDYMKINWHKVRDFSLKLVNQNDSSNYEYITTLNLEQSVVKMIEKIQLYFRDIFCVSRVHRAFVVRMILKANYLLENNLID